MKSAALDTDQWLKDNAFHCIRLDANISKSACGLYRAENQDKIFNRGSETSPLDITIPGCCQGCAQADGKLLESAPKRAFTANLYPKRKKKKKTIKKVETLALDITPEPKIKEEKMANKKTGECIGPCGRKNIGIKARGMCANCYRLDLEAEKTAPVKKENPDKEIVTFFIKESCVIGDCEITLLDLYGAYKKWWCENPENEKKRPLNNIKFFRALDNFKTESKGGQTYIQGIAMMKKEPIQENADIGDVHDDLSIHIEKEDATDLPAIDPEKEKAADAVMEKIGVKGPFDGLDEVPFDPNFSPMLDGEKLVTICRECGCTNLDCSVCIEKTGQPCYWVEPDLCSACVPDWIPCRYDPVKDEFEIYGMGPYTLSPGERVVSQREETEAALLDDLTVLEVDNVASVTKILRIGEREIERTTVYKNQSSGKSGLRGYLPAIVAPIVISALILIEPTQWRVFVFAAIQVSAVFAIFESRNHKG